jgi:hypothetical protein
MVDFYDFTVVSAQLDRELAGLGDVAERARRNGARQGTPVVVHTVGRVDARVNAFFRSGAMAVARPTTWRRYAFALVVWLNFLDALDRTWDNATGTDVEAFKEWRLTDGRNGARVAPTSFDTDRAALNSFYRWANLRYGVANPVPSATVARGGRRVGGDGGWGAGLRVPGRDGLRPAQARRRQVKWMLRPAFEQWRDIGLRGYAFDGLRQPGWRGVARLKTATPRSSTACMGQGFGSPSGRACSMLSCRRLTVAGSGDRGSRRRAPRAATPAASTGSRVACSPHSPATWTRSRDRGDWRSGRAQAAGRYETLRGVRIVTAYHPRARTLSVLESPGTVGVSVDVLGPHERRRLFRCTETGLEPLWVWLGPDGMPKQPQGWEDTFAAANARVAAAWEAAGGKAGECPLWARPHMCRHSFCLKWFSILSVVWEQRVDGFTESEIKDLRYQFGDIWLQLATLMGHVDPATTRDIYLEPFTSLRVDYLMSLLDEDEKSGLDTLVRAVAADSTDRVLVAADPHSDAPGADGETR